MYQALQLTKHLYTYFFTQTLHTRCIQLHHTRQTRTTLYKIYNFTKNSTQLYQHVQDSTQLLFNSTQLYKTFDTMYKTLRFYQQKVCNTWLISTSLYTSVHEYSILQRFRQDLHNSKTLQNPTTLKILFKKTIHIDSKLYTKVFKPYKNKLHKKKALTQLVEHYWHIKHFKKLLHHFHTTMHNSIQLHKNCATKKLSKPHKTWQNSSNT